MSRAICAITVFFKEPFLVGIFEKIEDDKISVARVVFDDEPKDYQVYQFVLQHYDHLQFSPVVAAVVKDAKEDSERMQRAVDKQLQEHGIGTKAQQVLKLQYEQNKQERKVQYQEQKLAKAECFFN